jgi:hypothetical protein
VSHSTVKEHIRHKHTHQNCNWFRILTFAYWRKCTCMTLYIVRRREQQPLVSKILMHNSFSLQPLVHVISFSQTEIYFVIADGTFGSPCNSSHDCNSTVNGACLVDMNNLCDNICVPCENGYHLNGEFCEKGISICLKLICFLLHNLL